MKAILLSIFVFSFSLWGAEPKVVAIDKLQKRGKAGSQLTYIPNQDTPFTGKAVSYWPNGQKAREWIYKDGKFDGVRTEWWQNGQKERAENYKDGKEDGLFTIWYEDGQKELEAIWKDGKQMSAVVWKPNGEKCPVTKIDKEGNGVVALYNEDGSEMLRLTFKDGELVED